MVDLLTITEKEVKNFLKIWKQTLVPPVINSLLYILIFGNFIGSQMPNIEGVRYIDFIFPGLLMMGVIMGSYALTSFGFFSSKMFKNLEELLVSSISYRKIIIGFCLAGVVRGTLVGLCIFIISLLMVDVHIYNYFYLFTFILLTSIVFSLAGLVNGIFAKSFDDVNIVPAFVITPLIYLGGVFYSTEMLSPFWSTVSQFNPILYMINGIRYAFIGISDVNIGAAIAILLVFTITLYTFSLYLLKKGSGIKT